MHTNQSSFGRSFLRWLLFLPAAAVGGVLGYVVPKVIYTLMGQFVGFNVQPGSVYWYIFELIASGASSGFALGFGCRTAPKHQRIVFAFLALVFCAYHLPAMFSLTAEFRGSLLVGLIGMTLGIVIAASEMGEWDDDKMEPGPALQHDTEEADPLTGQRNEPGRSAQI